MVGRLVAGLLFGFLCASGAAAQNEADEQACLDLQLRYAQHRDAGELDAFVALFTSDGVMRLAGHESKGREALREGARARMAGPTLRHVVSNQRVVLESPDQARGSSYATVIGGDATGAPVIQAVVEYHDRYRREGGQWRIAERETRIVFAGAPPPGGGAE